MRWSHRIETLMSRLDREHSIYAPLCKNSSARASILSTTDMRISVTQCASRLSHGYDLQRGGVRRQGRDLRCGRRTIECLLDALVVLAECLEKARRRGARARARVDTSRRGRAPLPRPTGSRTLSSRWRKRSTSASVCVAGGAPPRAGSRRALSTKRGAGARAARRVRVRRAAPGRSRRPP